VADERFARPRRERLYLLGLETLMWMNHRRRFSHLQKLT
jgi:hypothetical protein